jgi:hypothetical protein
MRTACIIFSTLLWTLTGQAGARVAQSSLRSSGIPANTGARRSGSASIGNHQAGTQEARNYVAGRRQSAASRSVRRAPHAEKPGGSTAQTPLATLPAAKPESLRAPSRSATAGMAAPRIPVAAVRSATVAQPLAFAHRRNANPPLIDGNMTTRRGANSALDGMAVHRRR